MHDALAREPEELAAALGVLVDGASVQSAVFASLDPIRAARTTAAQLLANGTVTGR